MTKAADDDYVAYVSARLPALKRLANQLCGSKHRADDLVQETITKVYIQWAKVSAADRMDQYVNSIMVRTHIDETRRSWFRVRLFDSPPERGVEDRAHEDRAIVHQALAGLPARQRAAVVLRFIYDLPIYDVAGILGCSAGTVKSQAHLGLAKLRTILDQQSRFGDHDLVTGRTAREH